MHTLKLVTAVLLVSGLLFGGISPAQAQALPPEAEKVIKDYEAFEAQARKKMDDEIMSQYHKALADLKAIQDDLTKKGNLDGALAVRNGRGSGCPQRGQQLEDHAEAQGQAHPTRPGLAHRLRAGQSRGGGHFQGDGQDLGRQRLG